MVFFAALKNDLVDKIGHINKIYVVNKIEEKLTKNMKSHNGGNLFRDALGIINGFS